MSEILYYSQNREDKWIAENLGHLLPEKGFYVDIGCAHPFETSNTAFLRDRKWDGLAVDGDRRRIAEWEGIPAFRCSIISDHHVVKFLESEVTWHSRIDPDHGETAFGITLDELLEAEEVGKIDFLSVDTEGTEFEVLQMVNWEKHEPTIVVAEYNAQHLPIVKFDQSPILPFMLTNGYELKHIFEPINMIFAK